jgi:putative transposase
MSDEYPLKRLCVVFAVSRSGYYAWTQAPGSVRTRRDDELRAKIAVVHRQSRETYGSPRVTIELQTQGGTGRSASRRPTHAGGRPVRPAKAALPGPHDRQCAHAHPIAPNRLATLPVPTKPNRVWVSDLTCVPTDEGWLYVAGVLDRCSRCLVGCLRVPLPAPP